MKHYRSRWLRYGGLCVLAVLVFLGASFMQERGLGNAVDAEIHRAVVFGEDTIEPLVRGASLSSPLPASIAEPLAEKLDREVLSSAVVVRVRLFARDGSLIFSTDDGDRIGTKQAGNTAAVRDAAVGSTSGLEDLDRVSLRGDNQSLRLLAIYVPLSVGGGKADAVLAVDQRYRPIQEETAQPWRALQLLGLGAAIVFLELFLLWLVRHISAARLASRSGFAPLPGTPARGASEKDVKAAEKEANIRAALEEQIETLRAQLKGQAEAAKVAEVAAEDRIRQAEERSHATPDPEAATALQASRDRAGVAEQKLGQAEHRLQEAEARVTELVAELRATQERGGGAKGAEAAAELERAQEEVAASERRAAGLERQAEDAAKAARDQEQRAASVEAARAELETKLAQGASAAQGDRSRVLELEASIAELQEKLGEATDLAREGGRRVDEAVASGDAAREELTRTMSEREELSARVATLEASLADATRSVQDLMATSEDERARGQAVGGELVSVREELAAAKRAHEDAERQIGDADARAKAAESRLAAAASDLSTEAATLAAELDAERERLRRTEERAVEAERRGDEMDKHASSLAQALEDERVKREEARDVATEATAALAVSESTLEAATATTAALETRAVEAETALAAALSGAGEQTSAMQAELDAAAEREREAQAQVDAATTRATEATSRIEELTLEVAALRELTVESQRASGASSEELTALRAEVATQLEQARASGVRVLELEALTGEADSTIAALREGADAATKGAVERAQQAEAAAAELEQRLAAQAAETEQRLAAQAATSDQEQESSKDQQVAALQLAVQGLKEELDSMGMRLRRAYADAEDARAQMQFLPAAPGADIGGPSSQDGLDEVQKLRLELGRAVERASAAEARSARMQAELVATLDEQAPDEGAPEDDAPEEERSLRFRLAKSAARKKGMDRNPAGSGGGSGTMWG